MGSVDVLREITPLSPEDCFLVMQRPKRSFSYPLHVHPYSDICDLNKHAWLHLQPITDQALPSPPPNHQRFESRQQHSPNSSVQIPDILEITIQFHASLFDSFINKRHFKTIKDMFEKASCGLVFSREMILRIQPELKKLSSDKPDL